MHKLNFSNEATKAHLKSFICASVQYIPNPFQEQCYYTEHCHKQSFFVKSFDIQQWSGFKKVSPDSRNDKNAIFAGAKYKLSFLVGGNSLWLLENDMALISR
jgi:hypothetical protein